MFRKMRRFKQQISEERCVELLETQPRGVLALLGDGGYPYALPINFVYHEHKLYFHCAGEGHKIDALRQCDKASFCVMDQGFRREGEWALNIQSVIIFGRLRMLTDREDIIRMVRLLGQKYYSDAGELEREIEKTRDRVACLELEIEHMTGKLVNES